jgi:transposase
MLELKQEGKSIKEIARIFEVSPRTVQRWLKAVAGRESKVGQVGDEMVQVGCRIAKQSLL